MSDPTIAELGETEALSRTVARLELSGEGILVGSGDDAAVLEAKDSFVVSTDTLVEDHDFKTEWSSGFDIGFKSVASNLADIAAMGAKPTGLVVALVAPKETKISWLESFADGLQAALSDLSPSAKVVGGDLAAGEKIVVAVTVFGSLNGERAILRSGAKPGDLVAVAGTLGRAACGLALLQYGKQEFINSYDEFVAFQLRPKPPIALGVVANTAGATAMLDVSDGLLIDASRIAKASKVAIDISASELKGFEAMLEQPALSISGDAAYWVLNGGEDHALLASFPSDAEIPKGFKVIGRVIESSDPKVLLDGKEIAPLGWDSVRGISEANTI